jgi:hypothetical protein
MIPMALGTIGNLTDFYYDDLVLYFGFWAGFAPCSLDVAVCVSDLLPDFRTSDKLRD